MKLTMKKLLNKAGILACIVWLGVLGGCYKTEYGQELTERAEVDDTILAPSQHGSASGIAIDGKGRVGPTFSSVDIAEKYAVVFRCQHGKFIIEGTDDRHKDLWQRMKRGEQVIVRYREQYRVEKDGSKTLTKYDFLDAQPAQVEAAQ